jgi:hypothetical protein
MYPQNDGGQLHQQPEWGAYAGAASRYPGQSQPQQLSRPEVWELYRVTLTAMQENLRRRDRTNWFFLTASFAGLTTLLVLLVALDNLLIPATVSLLALFIGAPLCLLWRSALRCSTELHEKNLEAMRRIEQVYGLPYPPFTVEAPPLSTFSVKDSQDKPIRLFSRWETFLPNVALTLFLVLVIYVWRDPLATAFWWSYDHTFGLFSPGTTKSPR